LLHSSEQFLGLCTLHVLHFLVVKESHRGC
jgi:hypothetical protein